jgi:Flp pilus assembly protein TadG
MRRFANLRREDGQALVEFALVLPILLMVATGITSFGLVFYHYITIEDAVRSGARTLSLGRGNTAPSPNDPCTEAQNATFNSAVDAGLQRTNIHLIVNGVPMQPGSCPGTGSNWNQGNTATVTATVPCTINIVGLNLSCPGGNITAQATDAVE